MSSFYHVLKIYEKFSMLFIKDIFYIVRLTFKTLNLVSISDFLFKKILDLGFQEKEMNKLHTHYSHSSLNSRIGEKL